MPKSRTTTTKAQRAHAAKRRELDTALRKHGFEFTSDELDADHGTLADTLVNLMQRVDALRLEVKQACALTEEARTLRAESEARRKGALEALEALGGSARPPIQGQWPPGWPR